MENYVNYLLTAGSAATWSAGPGTPGQSQFRSSEGKVGRQREASQSSEQTRIIYFYFDDGRGVKGRGKRGERYISNSRNSQLLD